MTKTNVIQLERSKLHLMKCFLKSNYDINKNNFSPNKTFQTEKSLFAFRKLGLYYSQDSRYLVCEESVNQVNQLRLGSSSSIFKKLRL